MAKEIREAINAFTQNLQEVVTPTKELRDRYVGAAALTAAAADKLKEAQALLQLARQQMIDAKVPAAVALEKLGAAAAAVEALDLDDSGNAAIISLPRTLGGVIDNARHMNEQAPGVTSRVEESIDHLGIDVVILNGYAANLRGADSTHAIQLITLESMMASGEDYVQQL